MAAVVALVALRLGIGWHFFKEGVKKFHDPNFTANIFFEQSTGPASELFRLMIPDRNGHARLDRQGTKELWQQHANRVGRHFGFDESQQKKAQAVAQQWSARLDQFFADNRDDIREYFLEVERVKQAKADKTTRQVAFRRDWITSQEVKLRGQLASWASRLQLMGKQYQEDLRAIATDQQQQRGYPNLPDRSRSILDTVVKYFITGVGVFLVLGLLTRLTSLAGAGFLVSVLATQPPWVPGAELSFFYYQLVELLALLLLAAMGAGRFAGLDFFIQSICVRCCPPDKGEE